MIIKSFAKLNLSLDLAGKRDDGYHLLRTVMQTVSLCDIITVDKLKSGIVITCNKRYIPTDERNIVYKIAVRFFEYTGIQGGVKIHLKKIIPCGAGLGGGSSNGAQVLNALCKLYGVEMSIDGKVELTKTIGADIPFFFYGGTALCEGIGEIVTPLTPIPECWMVIAKPPVSISTAAIFASPLTNSVQGDSTDGVIEGIQKQDIVSAAEHFGNALENASIEICPMILDIKNKLMSLGAVTSMMSGSGSSVFGVFTCHKQARQAYLRLRTEYKETYIVKPC